MLSWPATMPFGSNRVNTNASTNSSLTAADVTGVWAGLRPLIAGGSVGDKTKDLSRKHGVTTSEGGVTTITGGKLTTYRRMAADTIDAVADRLGVKGRSRTKKLRLVGAEGAQPADEHLRGRFGSLGADVLTLAHWYARRKHEGHFHVLSTDGAWWRLLSEPPFDGLEESRVTVWDVAALAKLAAARSSVGR